MNEIWLRYIAYTDELERLRREFESYRYCYTTTALRHFIEDKMVIRELMKQYEQLIQELWQDLIKQDR